MSAVSIWSLCVAVVFVVMSAYLIIQFAGRSDEPVTTETDVIMFESTCRTADDEVVLETALNNGYEVKWMVRGICGPTWVLTKEIEVKGTD